jgi:hypothetical protein
METPNDENDEIFVDEKVLDILRESLKHKLKKQRKYPKKNSNNALKAVMQEFLTCGKLLGYDLDGNVVEITFFANKMEDAAVQNLFVQKFGEFMGTKMNIGDDF